MSHPSNIARIKQSISILLLSSIYFGMLSPMLPRISAAEFASQTNEMPAQQKNTEIPDGLSFRLSEGAEGAEKREVSPIATGDALSDSQSSSLLRRLPEIKVDEDDQKDFAKREGSLPAPRTGKTNEQSFPSTGDLAPKIATASEKLEVLRFSPKGDVPLVSDLSITFSQPMVALSSQEEAANNVPVKLTPEVKGKWRWLGTKTLIFDAETRFPMATKFTATVPAGTKSAIGGILAKETTWNFATPTVKVTNFYPNNTSVRRDALMFASFDQQINADAILQRMKVIAVGQRLNVRHATKAEIESDKAISNLIKTQTEGRWIAFRAIDANSKTENALPSDSTVNVEFPVGTPSAEGNLTTAKAQNYKFTTYGLLKFLSATCDWIGNISKNNCSPSGNFTFKFSNRLDTVSFDAKKSVKIEPEIPNAQIFISGNYLYIQADKPGRKTYKVTVDGSLKDEFGQTLGTPAVATFTTAAERKILTSNGGNFVTLDPNASPTYSVYTTNLSSLQVRLYSVSPNNFEQFRKFMGYVGSEVGKKKLPPGKLVSDKIVKIQTKPDEMVETRIDLANALNKGFGHVFMIIEPAMQRDKGEVRVINVWAQATNIGLDAFVDYEQLVGFASSLKDGKPLGDVQMSIYPFGEKLAEIDDGKTDNSLAEIQPEKPEKGLLATIYDKVFGPSAPENIELPSEIHEAEMSPSEPTADSVKTSADGTAQLVLPPKSKTERPSFLVARKGIDTAILPEDGNNYYVETGTWYKDFQTESLRWYVFDDRKMYRPKEEVSIKGWLRKISAGKLADVSALEATNKIVNYVVKDSRDNVFARGEAKINGFGGFDFKIKLPDNINLGQTSVEFTNSDEEFTHYFNVQEFRRPEFEVSAKTESEAPHLVGASANVSVEAKYFAGGALPNAEVNWNVRATATNYTPPNRADFTFGKWTPWWIDGNYDFEGGYRRYNYGRYVAPQTFKSVTDAAGKHHLKIDFDSVKPARPYSVTAEASVMDVNRQTWNSSTTLLVHPSDLYVGIRTPRTFVNPKEKFEVETIATDIDGKAVVNRNITVKAILKDWVFDKGAWKNEAIDTQECQVSSANEAVKCSFTATQGGVYTISAMVLDDRERANESELTLWVSGGKTPPKRNVEQEEVQLIPAKKEFGAGETAEILIQSPIVPAEGVLTLRRNGGIVKTERFSMNEPSFLLKIPIEDRYLPNIYAQVDLVGTNPRPNDKGEIDEKLGKRPAFASGEINLTISKASRTLTVTAEPTAKNLEPGGATNINVEVKDNSGKAAPNSEVAIVVVDESVLALSGYKLDNPLDIFYTNFASDVSDFHSRNNILLANPGDLRKGNYGTPTAYGKAAGGGGGGSEFGVGLMLPAANMSVAKSPAKPMAMGTPKPMLNSEATGSLTISGYGRNRGNTDEISAQLEIARNLNEPIKLRENFNALAVWSPSVKTDANGKAVVPVKLPDNLTRYRIMAVAVSGAKQFGSRESNLTARQPLMVRASAPRFMNFGDKIELPVVVQNQTDNPMTVEIAVRATNAELTAEKGKRVTIAPNDRAEVRFPVSAVKAGTARFQIGVSSGKFADAAEVSLPVYTPATTEAFATYGTIDENGTIVQPIKTPLDVWSQFGGLEVTTSSTQLQELTEAFIYLTKYPYDCSEQISSQILSIAALRDVLTAFKAKDLPKAAELKSDIDKKIQTLASRQNDNGSFGLWRKNDGVDFPFISIHVTHALARAKAKGYKVPDEMLAKANNYLKNIESRLPKWYGKESKWAISAYALYVRNLSGDTDLTKARSIIRQAGSLEKLRSFETIGWLYSVFAKAKDAPQLAQIRAFLNNRVTETAGTAHFVTNYEDGAYVLLASNRRADGIILEALLADKGGNVAVNSDELITKIVRSLLANRQQGRWGNTQENIFILLALDKYFNTFEKVTPDFVAKIWLGETFAGEQSFKGRSTDFNQVNVPLKYLAENGANSNLLIDKQGAGRLYYRLGMKYAPKDLNLKAADFGFTVLRNYEAIDDKDDVKHNADGTWTIKAGAKVRVRLKMVAPTRRYHVALVDNIPAGLEILNPELAVTGTVPQDTSETGVVTFGSPSYGYGNWFWRGTWFEHQNFRDERAEAFTSLLWEGVWNYSYVARATTPGQFVVPPAKAEEMYAPETFGRSSTDFVKVE